MFFTGLGFYPVAPGSNQYVIGRPFVDRAVLNLPNGKHFTVRADNLSAANRYVGRVLLNGRPLVKGYVTDAQIRDGGELRFVMQATPDKAWATAPADRPYSLSGYGAE